jgi:Ca-activated chloride channel homolog
MHFSMRSYRLVGCCIFSISIALLDALSGFSQAPQPEQSFPTQANPKVVISNASTISITSWDKNEVSIATEVSGSVVKAQEVIIKSESNKLDISCRPAKPDRRISLTLRVPAKAVLEIKSHGNKVEVKEPRGLVSILAGKEYFHLNVPESSSLDMRDAPQAVDYRQFGQGGWARIGIGKRQVGGTGPPFVKVTAETAQVTVAHGNIFIATANTPAPKPLTIAATTIARRNSSMARVLRRSNPQLIRPQRDQSSAANSADIEEGALKLETHLINLNVGATDREGRAIPGLNKDDLSIYEDGVLQRISFFSPERAPFNLVLLIDLSGSMKDEIELIKETALHFLDVISAQDSVAVITFTTDVTVVSHLTKDRDDLRESIEYMLAPAGGTAFYDALGYALVETLRKVKGQRNAVIAITDGEDNLLQAKLMEKLRTFRGPVAGSFLTFEELLDGAREADALIYPIHFNPTPPQPIVMDNRPPPTAAQSPLLQIQSELTGIAKEQLHSLADATGGRFYHANRIADLKGVFEQVAAELRTVYSMAYTTTNLNFDGRFRRIRVQVNKPDVLVRTRPGYYGR